MTITKSSGNVFADLCFADAEERLAKTDLVLALDECIHARGLSQRNAALVLGVGQGSLSKLLGGDLDGFSMDRVTRMLNAFDQDVTINVGPKRGDCARTVVEREPVRAFAAAD